MGVARIRRLSIADAQAALDRFVSEAATELVPITAEIGQTAVQAFERFGRGRHPARLNMGDCFAYACARSLDEYSFPSGHAMHAVAYSVLLGVYYPEFTPLLWGFTALVALSRVVLGLHYPSDVVIGAAIGLLTAESALSLL